MIQDLKLGCQRLRLVTSNTLFFYQSSSSLRSQTQGGRIPPPPPPPPCAVKDDEMASDGEGLYNLSYFFCLRFST